MDKPGKQLSVPVTALPLSFVPETDLEDPDSPINDRHFSGKQEGSVILAKRFVAPFNVDVFQMYIARGPEKTDIWSPCFREPDTGWQALSLQSDWTMIDRAHYRKVGQWVHVQVAVSSATESGTSTLATLPTGFRPDKPVGGALGTDSSSAKAYEILTNGDIVFYSVSTSSRTWTAFTVSYLID